ncbi:Tnt-2 [Aphelenchoides besseyi]|nr:Tnt-2 [Aphelenchoides besseyi]
MSAEEESVYDEEEEEEEVEEAEAPAETPAAETEAAPETEDGGEEEEDENEAPTEEEKPRSRPPPPPEPERDPESMTEAEQAMLAAKKRHEEEQEAKMADYEQRRLAEREQIEQELRELKEKQIERRKQREQEEAEFAERRREDEARRRQQEEERKAKIEAEKVRRAEEKMKRQQMMAGGFAGFQGGAGEGKNFVIPEKGEASEDSKPGLGQPSTGRKGLSSEQKAEAKRNYMSIVNRPVDVSNLLPNDIKAKIKQLHAKIVKLEGEKYDLEKRQERQDYDLKELTEREKNQARSKAMKAGVEPTEDAGSGPPKVNVSSKFDRQVDRRSYGDRRNLFEKPFVKPAPSIAHGSGRPPPQWGAKNTEELEVIRKTNEERPKYIEAAPIDKVLPCQVIPMQIPTEEFDENAPQPGKRHRGSAVAGEETEEPVAEEAPEEVAA